MKQVGLNIMVMKAVEKFKLVIVVELQLMIQVQKFF